MSSTHVTETNEGEWGKAINEVKSRFKKAKGSIPYSAYILVGVIGLGGMGIWLPASMSDTTTWYDHGNHFTYSAALMFMLAVESLIGIPEDKESNNQLTALALIIGAIAFLCIFAGYLSHTRMSSFFSISGTIISILLFIVSNTNNPKFFTKKEPIPPAGAVGPQKVSPSELKNKQIPKKGHA